MFSAGNPGSQRSRRSRLRRGLRRTRYTRRFRPALVTDEALLEVRLTPSTLDLSAGALTYTAADGEINQLTVDVVQSDGVEFVRLRESASITIEATGDGLVVNSGHEVLVPSASVSSL